MVYRKVALLVYRSKFKLVWRHLVVAGLARNAKLKSLHFEVFHESLDTFRNGSEVVVVHLLVLCGVVTHERASGKQQVGTCGIKTFVHEEILLFPSQIA
ncbi:unknown [Prevotella sp. CAG:487]|nr:unknown [Prevotella sp. CAG:487]